MKTLLLTLVSISFLFGNASAQTHGGQTGNKGGCNPQAIHSIAQSALDSASTSSNAAARSTLSNAMISIRNACGNVQAAQEVVYRCTLYNPTSPVAHDNFNVHQDFNILATRRVYYGSVIEFIKYDNIYINGPSNGIQVKVISIPKPKVDEGESAPGDILWSFKSEVTKYCNFQPVAK